jgi:hypothetical protein
MKKLLLLSIIQLFVLTNLSAQQTNDLRGVRYYYSTPSLGPFSSYSSFKPFQIEETANDYLLTGYTHSGIFLRNAVVSIEKENSIINWDYYEEFESSKTNILKISNDKLLTAYNLSDYPGNDQLIRTVVFSMNGSYVKKYFSPDTNKVSKINSISLLDENHSVTNGYKYNIPVAGQNPFPQGYSNLYHIDSSGVLIDSLILPIENTFHNLPVWFSNAYKTFPYKNQYLTFGIFFRQTSIETPNLFGYTPVIWQWNSDNVLSTKEIYSDYTPNSSEVSADELLEIDGENNEFVIAVLRPTDGNSYLHTTPVANFITFIDSNLTVVWDKKVGTLPSPYYYNLEDIKYNSSEGYIYACGFVLSSTDDTYEKLFLAKYAKNGQLVFIKHFAIGNYFNVEINSMNILATGDLIFAGRGYNSNLNKLFFFTYRTGPDGYHEDGAYLGLEEVLASETEIGIFPNPSEGIFQVSSISTEPMQITMLDQQGKQVAQFELNELSSDNSFDLSDQAPGVYFAHISQGEQQWVKKLVVR